MSKAQEKIIQSVHKAEVALMSYRAFNPAQAESEAEQAQDLITDLLHYLRFLAARDGDADPEASVQQHLRCAVSSYDAESQEAVTPPPGYIISEVWRAECSCKRIPRVINSEELPLDIWEKETRDMSPGQCKQDGAVHEAECLICGKPTSVTWIVVVPHE